MGLLGDSAKVAMQRSIRLQTELGERVFTDYSIEYKGEHYGARAHGLMDQIEVGVEAMRLMSRIDRERRERTAS